MDGFTLAEHIRNSNPSIPILFITARSLKSDKLTGFRSGGDDYITKPFSMEVLESRIQVFLKRRNIYENVVKQTVLSNGLFDYTNLLLITPSKEIKLTRREADLMHFLCNNQNKVCKREEILNSIWGEDDYFLGRSLDVFISRLRKYVKELDQVDIENYHGVGFKMSVKS